MRNSIQSSTLFYTELESTEQKQRQRLQLEPKQIHRNRKTTPQHWLQGGGRRSRHPTSPCRHTVQSNKPCHYGMQCTGTGSERKGKNHRRRWRVQPPPFVHIAVCEGATRPREQALQCHRASKDRRRRRSRAPPSS